MGRPHALGRRDRGVRCETLSTRALHDDLFDIGPRCCLAGLDSGAIAPWPIDPLDTGAFDDLDSELEAVFEAAPGGAPPKDDPEDEDDLFAELIDD